MNFEFTNLLTPPSSMHMCDTPIKQERSKQNEEKIKNVQQVTIVTRQSPLFNYLQFHRGCGFLDLPSLANLSATNSLVQEKCHAMWSVFVNSISSYSSALPYWPKDKGIGLFYTISSGYFVSTLLKKLYVINPTPIKKECFYFASKGLYADLNKYITEIGIDIQIRDIDNNTLLMAAANYGKPAVTETIINLIRDQNNRQNQSIDLHSFLEARNNLNETALMIAKKQMKAAYLENALEIQDYLDNNKHLMALLSPRERLKWKIYTNKLNLVRYTSFVCWFIEASCLCSWKNRCSGQPWEDAVACSEAVCCCCGCCNCCHRCDYEPLVW